MKIIELEFENWYTLAFSINWMVLLGSVAVICGLVFVFKKIVNRCISGSIEVDEVSLGIGDSSIKLKYNKKDQEIAYKLWVELNTRKIGLQFDENNDVIDEAIKKNVDLIISHHPFIYGKKKFVLLDEYKKHKAKGTEFEIEGVEFVEELVTVLK